MSGEGELSDLSWLCSSPAPGGIIYVKQKGADVEQQEIMDVDDDILEDSGGSCQDPLDPDDSKTSKYHKQTYRKAWESLPDFKGWLKGVDGQPNRAYCSFCRVSLFAHRLSLLKHTCTLKHQRASQKVLLLNKSINSEIGPGGNVTSEIFQSEVTQTVSSAKKQQINSIDYLKLNTQSLKSQVSGMTVTVIKDVTEGVTGDETTADRLQLGLGLNVEDTEKNAVINDYNDIGVNSRENPPIIVRVKDKNESETQEMISLPKPMIMAQSGYPLSTHVLDTSKGKPVGQLSVSLYRLMEGRWILVNEGVTTQEGRCNQLIQKSEFVAGRYKLHFDTDRYFELERKETLYPFIEIVFDVHAPLEHYHIPLLLSPFGYSTYRGS